MKATCKHFMIDLLLVIGSLLPRHCVDVDVSQLDVEPIEDYAFIPGVETSLWNVGIEVFNHDNLILVQFDRSTYTWARVGLGYGPILNGRENGFEALYGVTDGFLYGENVINGQQYRFSLDESNATLIATGEPVERADGDTLCSSAQIVN